MRKKVSEKKIKSSVKKWLLTLQQAYSQGYSIVNYQMNCPSCESETIHFNETKKIWCCSNPSCRFVFPGHLTPPKLAQIEEYFRHKERERVEKYIENILNS